jgi:hypothetical protein
MVVEAGVFVFEITCNTLCGVFRGEVEEVEM